MSKAPILAIILLAGFLPGCNSTESALNVQGTGQSGNQNTSANNTPPTSGTATSQPTANTAATAPVRSAGLKPGKLYIAPIVGAPVNVVTPLTHRINDDARAKGIQLAASNDPSAAYVMKGYFSALSEDNQTTILYVWDVLDASGNRLHRIQGQEKIEGTSADSWSIVQPAAMQAIADRTMQEYSTWLAANRA